MSTSDMVLLINVPRKQPQVLGKTEKKEFFRKLENLMEKLAQYIVRDGEGASKFITIDISGAKNNNDAKLLPCLLLTHHFLKQQWQDQILIGEG